MTSIKPMFLGAAILLGASVVVNAQAQYTSQAQGYPPIQYYPYNVPPATPPSWSYNPYTSGLGPCPERARGDDRCAERILPTAGQPNYWIR
jgi:hypothetical protein